MIPTLHEIQQIIDRPWKLSYATSIGLYAGLEVLRRARRRWFCGTTKVPGPAELVEALKQRSRDKVEREKAAHISRGRKLLAKASSKAFAQAVELSPRASQVPSWDITINGILIGMEFVDDATRFWVPALIARGNAHFSDIGQALIAAEKIEERKKPKAKIPDWTQIDCDIYTDTEGNRYGRYVDGMFRPMAHGGVP